MLWWAVLAALATIALMRILFTRLPISAGVTMKARIEDVLQTQDQAKYDLKGFEFPPVTGLPFKIFTYLTYTRFGKYILGPGIVKSSNLNRMALVQIPENPTFYPIPDVYVALKDHCKSNKETLQECVEMELSKEESERPAFQLTTVVDYIRAYRSGKVMPSEVAKRVLEAIEDSDRSDPPLRAVVQSDRDAVLAMAATSDVRWKEGATLSYLDGVPVAIKEEICCEPYDLRGGASFTPLAGQGVPEAPCVQKLKAAGAVIIGVTNMHEFGTGTLGSNPHPPHLTGRNPYDPRRYAGGSSTGSAISVAAGFCPVAIGSDGGGSIRVPACVCGTVGLKPTFGVVDKDGTIPLSYTVSSLGPLAASVLDAAIALDIISQVTGRDEKTASLHGLGQLRVDGLKVGVFREHFKDADKVIVEKCEAAVACLVDFGAIIVEIAIPEMEDSRIAHAISIATECGSSLAFDVDRHYSDINPETHLVVANAVNMSAKEYINSQKQRTRAMLVLKDVFKRVDVIATPATACSIPLIRPDAMKAGIADGTTGAKMMRFNFLGNLTGIPGLVLPVGYTEQGLPVGLQLMASWYREDTLLRTGWVLEHSGKFPAMKPKVFYDVINNL